MTLFRYRSPRELSSNFELLRETERSRGRWHASRKAVWAMARSRVDAPSPTEAHDVVMCRRAWRQRKRGDERRAMLLLRDAAHRDESDARIWALYGVQCGRAGCLEAAARALGHAVWLRLRSQETRKAEVTRDVMARVLAL